MKLYYWLLELVFPQKCVLCRRLLEKDGLDLCPECRRNAPVYPSGKRKPQFLDSFAVVWYYEGSVRKSLLRFKFQGKRSYAQAYGRLLAMKLVETMPEGFDVLTWIPVSSRRKLHRGYDQVELIAKAMGRELDVAPVPTLVKVRHNRAQSGIQGDAQRRANVLGAYRVTAPELVQGKRVLLLDDILTTGATVSEAARMLKSSGAKEVYGAAVAARK